MTLNGRPPDPGGRHTHHYHLTPYLVTARHRIDIGFDTLYLTLPPRYRDYYPATTSYFCSTTRWHANASASALPNVSLLPRAPATGLLPQFLPTAPPTAPSVSHHGIGMICQTVHPYGAPTLHLCTGHGPFPRSYQLLLRHHTVSRQGIGEMVATRLPAAGSIASHVFGRPSSLCSNQLPLHHHTVACHAIGEKVATLLPAAEPATTHVLSDYGLLP